MSNPEQHDADGIREDRKQRPPLYFTVLFYGLIVWGVIFCAYYLLSGWSSSGEFQQRMAAHRGEAPPSGAATAAAAPVVTATAAPDGKTLFAEHCAACHGAEAKGGYGPDLTRSRLDYGKEVAALRTSISAGRNSKMPAFGSKLSAAEIDALVNFILQL